MDFVSKNIYTDKKVVGITNFLAMSIFNDGFINILKMIEITV